MTLPHFCFSIDGRKLSENNPIWEYIKENYSPAELVFSLTQELEHKHSPIKLKHDAIAIASVDTVKKILDTVNATIVTIKNVEKRGTETVSKQVGNEETIVLKNIYFDFGKATIQEQSTPELNRLITFMKMNKAVKIEISGHTDNVGAISVNQRMSTSRAKAVYDYLISNGIVASRLSYKGVGYAQPIADNSTEEGRQQNRRVEFKILKFS